MNYLAHAYLSFGIPEVLVGNMISDFVKGKKQFDYPPLILQGIILHRAIDEFTDRHPVTQLAKKFFQADYRLYSAPFVDIVYDHFLATDHLEFSNESLMTFSLETYDKLGSFREVFPARFDSMFPYMKSQNWLYNYKFRWGLQSSFGGLVHRAAYLEESDTAFHLFEENYAALKNYYQEFFPELKRFAEKKLFQLGSAI